MAKIYFTEKQRFRKKWILIIISIPLILGVWGIIQQVILGKPFGNNPTSDGVLILISVLTILLIFFFFRITLITKITSEGVMFRFSPVQRKLKLIVWDKIKRAYIRKYKPIAEFGGWGFRRGRSGRAYNVSGKIGLQLEKNDGSKILIGTQKAEEIKRVLKKLEKAGINNVDFGEK